MMAFCGNQPFWDLNHTWYTDKPDFTTCFEDTVLAWTPCAFLWVLVGLDVYYALHSRGRNIPWSPLNISKLIVTAILITIQITLLVSYFVVEDVVYPVQCYTPVIRILTFGLVFFLIIFSKIKGVRSSGVQFLFWIVLAICEAFAFRTAILSSTKDPTQIEIGEERPVILILRIIYYPFVVCQFLLNCWADAAPTYEENPQVSGKSCPEESASFLSRLLFFWFDNLAWKGYRNPLNYDDLWDLNPEDKSNALVPAFNKHWKHALEEAKGVPDTRASFQKRSGSINIADAKERKKKKAQASVMGPIIKVFGPTIFLGALLKLLQDVLTFVSPQILKLLISYVSSSDKNSDLKDDWKGYLYATLLLLSSFIQTILLNQYFHLMFLVGMRLRTTLVSIIYKKSLSISSLARKETTVGEIVNLMSVDAQRFMDLMAYVNMIWSAPLQIALALYFLWDTLGPSVMAGLAVMLLLIPVNAFMASKLKTYQIRQMKYKDQRVKLMNEILSGIKVLKLYAWEPSFESQVMHIRAKEIKVLKDAAYLNAGTAFIWTCAPFLVAVVTFGTYVLMNPNNFLNSERAFVAMALLNIIRMPMHMLPMILVHLVQVAVVSFASFVLSDPGNILDAERAFVALSLFNILRFPLSMLPMVISTMVQASVSLKRIDKFMNSEEVNPNAVTHDAHEPDPIVIENGTFSWDPDTTVLRNINLRVKEGSLVALCGTVGSGKSSILSALLGEMEKKTGRVNMRGSIAYVAQQAWIQNATLRENILFGRPFEPIKYDQVVNGCALKPDLEMLTAGDKTEIGEKGINLSGGQKQRVSLARATYNNASVYLLDDPLSAVDSHVGKHIFENVLGPKGILRHKTRLLVTHGVTYLPQMDQIIVLKDGEVTETGTYKELLDKKGAFADFLIQHIGSGSGDDLEESSILQDLEQVVGIKIDRQRSRISESESEKPLLNRQLSVTSQESGGEQSLSRRHLSRQSMQSSIKTKSVPQASKDKLIEVEKSETGSVKLSVYLHYFRCVGWGLTITTLVFNIIFQMLSVGANMWLSEWSNSNENRTTPQEPSERDMYLGVYAGIGLGQAVAALVASVCLSYSTLVSAATTHKVMLRNILRSPMAFFETTPLGRVLNRFAKDVDVLDSVLALVFRSFLFCFMSVIATLIVISYSTPIFMAVILPIGILYFLVQRFYVATSRQLKRLESVTRSPIYSHFGETISGCTTIRAYSMQDRFMLESETKVDYNQLSYFPSIVSNRWVAVRLETVGNFIVFFAALFAVLQRETLNAGLVGLSISYALNVTQALNWLVRMTSDVEANIVAVERIKEYSEIPQEAAWENNETKPMQTWPETGAITFKGYKTRYREGLDLVLRDISCEIQPAEKIGIVGRTGAGKSSLTLALFRIVEAAGGSIIIDGKNISKLGLHDVRGRLTIIPQDPVLFSGTLRMNLDPFNFYTDEFIWRALELAHLKSFVKGLASGLEHEISEGGENLSVGQRQLICLARALLRKTKILVLDEATAAVDLETDDLIQQTIRSEFSDCTVVTIAHRLNTIMDSTRVMVLDKGEIREFDSPTELLKNKDSIFYGMAKDANII